MVARRILIALAVSLGGSALFTSWMIKRFSRPAAASGVELHYMVTTRNLQAGDVLSAGTLRLAAWPASAPLSDGFAKADGLNGRIVLFPLAAGEPINERQLAAAGSSAGLAMKIPGGMRAISLKSDQVAGVAGFVLPGTRVDVLVTYRNANSTDSITSTVLQDAQIIATGQKMEPDPEGKATTTDVVTLLASPGDAERVVEASSLGTVHLVLRNGADHQQLNTVPVQVSQLGSVGPATVVQGAAPAKEKNLVRLSPPAAAPLAAPPAKPYSVQMVYGEKTTESTQ